MQKFLALKPVARWKFEVIFLKCNYNRWFDINKVIDNVFLCFSPVTYWWERFYLSMMIAESSENRSEDLLRYCSVAFAKPQK